MNKVRIAFSFCSKQTESSKCHNHKETLTEQEYRCSIARAELPGNSSLRHWCLLLSTVATFFHPSMTANLFSSNVSSVFDQAWVGSRRILPPGYGLRYAGQQNCVCGRWLDESWRLAMQPVVAVDFCTWLNASLNNWQQGGCIPSIQYLKIASRRIVVARHYSKYPRISCCSPSVTVLAKKKFTVL